MHKDAEKTQYILSERKPQVGWYYQQLLKLYAAFVIPDISSNVLIVDADTIFLNPVHFLNAQHAGLYNPGTEYNPPYFEHAAKLIPNFKKLFPQHSGISHHMLFQKRSEEPIPCSKKTPPTRILGGVLPMRQSQSCDR